MILRHCHLLAFSVAPFLTLVVSLHECILQYLTEYSMGKLQFSGASLCILVFSIFSANTQKFDLPGYPALSPLLREFIGCAQISLSCVSTWKHCLGNKMGQSQVGLNLFVSCFSEITYLHFQCVDNHGFTYFVWYFSCFEQEDKFGPYYYLLVGDLFFFLLLF